MRKYIFYIIALFPVFSFAQGSKSTISGTIENSKSSATVYFYINARVDSVMSQNGSFKFSGMIEKPTFSTIKIKYNDEQKSVNQIRLYIVGGDVSLKLKYPFQPHIVRIEGPQETIDYTSKLLNPVLMANDEIDNIDKLLATARAANSKDTIALKNERKVAVARGFNISRTFVQTHPKSILSFIALKMMGIGERVNPNRVNDLKDLFSSLSPELKNSEEGKIYQQFLRNLK
jgi:hypothetical protein